MKLIRTKDGDYREILKNLRNRGRDAPEGVAETVAGILKAVRDEGDEALFRYTEKFDGHRIDGAAARVGREEIDRAAEATPPELLEALELAAERITRYHRRQLRESWSYRDEYGDLLGQRIAPLASVGLYVPGGKAAYPSSVLMNALPAKVAGVPRVVMVTPAPGGKTNPLVLAAARLAGVGEVYRVGGAQAVAALAYGTKTIPPVDKIVGPGNAYVAEAKRRVFGAVDIDMIAGPSEILVIADEGTPARSVAADLLSQAEHDEMAAAVLLTPDEELAGRVLGELEKMVRASPRRKVAEASLGENGLAVVVRDLGEACELADAFAPEHLELAVREPEALLDRIGNAGAIFLGRHTPEALGDYVAGPNHVLPTGGSARFSSPLSVDDFLKKTSILGCTPRGLAALGPAAAILAEAEGLAAHALWVKVRLENPAEKK